MVLVLGIVKASLEIWGIGIGVKKVVLLMSAMHSYLLVSPMPATTRIPEFTRIPEKRATMIFSGIPVGICMRDIFQYWSLLVLSTDSYQKIAIGMERVIVGI